MGIFDKRVEFKPFEYPEALEFSTAINHAYWLVSEWNFISDIQDFKTKLNEEEREILKRALLAISQIEISVKRFWTKLGDRFPKTEFEFVGVTFGESEQRHALGYSHLLEVLGFNDEFSLILEVPEIKGRVEYLTKYLKGASDNANENYTLTLTLFSIFIENVSLFSQFLVAKSFSQRNLLKDIDNVIQATANEECVHALFGVYLINQIKQEFPEWFNDNFYAKLYRACKKAYEAESKIIDWIFGDSELVNLSKDSVKEFVKSRFNNSLEMIGGKPVFEIDSDKLYHSNWFTNELEADLSTDFFHKKPVTYSKKVQSFQAESLF